MGASYSQGDINQYWNKVETPGNANLLEVGPGGKLTVYELNGDGKCNPLPGRIEVSKQLREVEQKRIFMTVPGDKRNLRLYVDNECDVRANEEAYMKKTSLNNQNILYFPATDQQNAGYYVINDTEPNKPPLPFFMVTPAENAKRRFAAESAMSKCRPSPYISSGENYGATSTKAAAFQRDLSHLTLYTDDKCTNIYDQTKEEIDQANNSYMPYSITTNPYNVVTGYGGRPMDNSKARYYMIKDDKWNVINDIDPQKMAAETARRAELARQKQLKEAREREEAFQRLLIQEQQERERKLEEKKKIQEASQAAAAANAKSARDKAERDRAANTQKDLVVVQEQQRQQAAQIAAQIAQRQRVADAFVKSLNQNKNMGGGGGGGRKCCVM